MQKNAKFTILGQFYHFFQKIAYLGRFFLKSQQIFFKPPRGVSGGVLEGTSHGGNAEALSACYKTWARVYIGLI